MNLLSYIIPQIVVRKTSRRNGEIKVTEYFGTRTLWVNNAEQSGGTITGMWKKAIGKISSKTHVETCLVLGLGGGTAIRLVQKKFPNISIDVVEFDPVIIDVAKTYFRLNTTKKIHIIQSDAFSWVKKQEEKAYDLIIFDLYLGKYNPKASRAISFLRDVKFLLTPKGFILFNAHYRNNEDEYQGLLTECRSVFASVSLWISYPYSRILRLGN